MTFWETVERGEYVMIALAVLVIVITLIWIVRSAKLYSQRKTYSTLMPKVRDNVVEGDIDTARQICGSVGSPGSKVVEAGLKKVGHPMQEVKSSIRETSEYEKQKMTAGTRWLRLIAVVSPLLGLGGTLVGVIDRLRDLGEGLGIVDLSVLCSNISPTIVTTVAGLGVGIFALIALTCLESTIDTSQRRLDMLGTEFTDFLNEPS